MASSGTRKRALLVGLLAQGRSYETAAAEAGCSKRSIVRWMADPVFAAEVRAARIRIVDEVVGQLAGEAAASVRTLVKLRDDGEGEATRLSACRVLLDRLIATRDLVDLDARIAALEERFKSRR